MMAKCRRVVVQFFLLVPLAVFHQARIILSARPRAGYRLRAFGISAAAVDQRAGQTTPAGRAAEALWKNVCAVKSKCVEAIFLPEQVTTLNLVKANQLHSAPLLNSKERHQHEQPGHHFGLFNNPSRMLSFSRSPRRWIKPNQFTGENR